MLRPMISPERRAEEIRLLNEYVASGRVRRIDYVPPEDEDETPEDVEQSLRDMVDGKEDLTDGNFRKSKLDQG